MRTQGSCRFADYYKVQFWNDVALCWQDIQKAFPTIDTAQAAFLKKKKCRIMQITTAGRFPVLEQTA